MGNPNPDVTVYTVFQSTPTGADSISLTNLSLATASVDLSVGETVIINFDMTAAGTGDAPTFAVFVAPAYGNLVVTDISAGLYEYTITHTGWLAAGSPATTSMSMYQSSTNRPADFFLNFTGDPTCFAQGTAIATPSGETAVEDLAVGDLILTQDGRAVPVRWLGRQTVNAAFADLPERVRLVRIRAGALGNGLPRRDLSVTADHTMYLNGLLINAGALVGMPGIDDEPLAEIAAEFLVFHVELDAHELILAEGSPTESFCDAAGRGSFDNRDDYLVLYGKEHVIREMGLLRVTSQRLVPANLLASQAA